MKKILYLDSYSGTQQKVQRRSIQSQHQQPQQPQPKVIQPPNKKLKRKTSNQLSLLDAGQLHIAEMRRANAAAAVI